MRFRNIAVVGALSMAASLGVLRAASATVLYDNGPEGQYYLAFPINDPGATQPSPVVSDSFSLASLSTLNGIDFGLALSQLPQPAPALQAVDWSITAGADTGASYGSGAASPTLQFLFSDPTGTQSFFTAGFTIPNVDLNAGTYYLNIWGASLSDNQNQAYWEDGSGPSLAYDSEYGGALTPQNTSFCFEPSQSSGYCSQSFQILGSVDKGTTAPEPGALALFSAGAGLLALAAALRGRRIGDRAG